LPRWHVLFPPSPPRRSEQVRGSLKRHGSEPLCASEAVAPRALEIIMKETHSKPSSVIAVNGRVLVDGPGHVDVALTPEAADETGKRLIDGAAIAVGHNRIAKIDFRLK
jgi:hypothetical protein